ncbi:SRPBCC family protein [Zhihengliuella salsuginis]|uniref:Activator of HSP90 ATPase n=1 Tax=Zhihengliuella salsuginis TaxID=578222 RepID=A0ABQ3GGM3_9MICC|nr:SRPBCC domain-containing protein [Zhihengliuella salsuginis]GHD03421.1 activator of HSP90 ATPase [Zhihengliuella salsuginis]
MPITSVFTDLEALTFTVTAEFPAEPERIWQLWADPRQLESWWGPPTWPATITRHEFAVGGDGRYYMTGPKGEKAGGWWHITEIEPPHLLKFEDGFSGEDGEPSGELGSTRNTVSIDAVELRAGRPGTRMRLVTAFESREQFSELAEMGLEDGLRDSIAQIDGLLDKNP